MDKLKLIFYGKPKVEKKTLIRDTKGRPYYLSKLPFYKKHPVAFAFGGGIVATLITFSGSIYSAFFVDPADLPPDAFLWPKERSTGITYLERVRQHQGSPPKQDQ